MTCEDKIWSFRTPLPFRHSRVRWYAETKFGHSAPLCHLEAAGPMTRGDTLRLSAPLCHPEAAGPMTRGDTLWLSAPFCHPEAAGPMTSRDQVWSFCTLVSSRGGGPDDTRKYPSGYPYKHSFAIYKTKSLIARRD